MSAEIEWRLDCYRRAFALCRQSGISYARFLGLVPSRLRLAVGESAARVRVPYAFDPETLGAWARRWPRAEAGGALPGDAAALRRALRFAQQDGTADPVQIARWLAGDGAALFAGLSQALGKGAAEIGTSDGGEASTQLVHLLVLRGLARVRTGLGADPASTLAVGGLLGLALRAVLERRSVEVEPSPRLALQLALAGSPAAFGDALERLGAPLGPYRSAAQAIGLAARVVQPPVEVIDLDRVIGVITERVLKDAALRAGVIADAYLERVRDAALLAAIQASQAGVEDSPERALASRPELLERAAREAGLRGQLRDAVGLRPGRAAQALVELLGHGEAALGGDPSALGAQFRLEARARSVATGAVVAALDQQTQALLQELSSLLDEVPAQEVAERWASGRCYRISEDVEPLFRLPRDTREAFLWVDTRAVAARALAVGASAAADFLARDLFGPVLELARQLAGPAGDRVRILRCGEDALAFSGDVVALLELALRVLRKVAASNRDRLAGASELRGGRPAALDEMADERRLLEARLAVIDDRLRRAADDEARRFLEDERRLLTERVEAVEASERALLAEQVGAEVVCGAALVWGEAAAAAPIPHVGALSVSPALVSARALTERSPRVARERARLEAHARRPPGAPDAEIPYRVLVRELQAPDDPDAAPFVEIHNAGCAISGEAVEAFRRARRGALRFEDVEVAVVDFAPEARRRYLLEGVRERLVLVRSAHDDAPLLAFRRSGRARLDHGVGATEVDVWEVLLAEQSYARALFESFGGRR